MGTKTGELRETLIEVIHLVKENKCDTDKALAIAKLAAQVTASLQVELQLRLQELQTLQDRKQLAIGSADLGETNVVSVVPAAIVPAKAIAK